MNTIVIYHRADMDGLCCAAIAHHFLGDEITLIGWDYGDPVPVVPDDCDLYMLDLCIEALIQHPNLTWIDHHGSAIAQHSSDIKGGCYLIDGVAACRLCWQFFTSRDALPQAAAYLDRKVSEPLVVRMIGEYDVFDLSDPDVVPLQFGLYAMNADISYLANLFPESIHTDKFKLLLEFGKVARGWQQQFALGVADNSGYILKWEGLTFFVLGSVHARSSMWFPEEVVPTECDALMNWRYAGGDKVAFSLYHRKGHERHDLSRIATKYGGGGHKGACGFMLPARQAADLVMSSMLPTIDDTERVCDATIHLRSDHIEVRNEGNRTFWIIMDDTPSCECLPYSTVRVFGHKSFRLGYEGPAVEPQPLTIEQRMDLWRSELDNPDIDSVERARICEEMLVAIAELSDKVNELESGEDWDNEL